MLAFGSAAPDAVPVVVDVCTLECDQGVLQVAVQLGNAGPGEVPANISVSVYAGQTVTGVLVATEQTGLAVESGQASDTLLFRLDPMDLPDGVITVAVDSPAGVLECKEDNNSFTIEEGLCP